METASLSFKLRTSMKEPSWTTVECGGAWDEAGDGEGRRKVDRVSFDKERARSAATGVSCRETGAGDVGRLEGRKSAVGLRVYIAG